MNILVLNSGSSSVKYQLIDLATDRVLVSGLVERIGEATGALRHKRYPGDAAEKVFAEERPFPDHVTALKRVVECLTDPEVGVIANVSEIGGTGHRIVHGGEAFSAPVVVDDAVVAEIRANIPLAPLHNPGGLAGIEVARELMPTVPNVAVFDTAFHQTMPPEAYLYAIPRALYKELRIRRYGFHGTSHRYVAKAAAKLLGKPLDRTSVITIHLGNGCSMAAVKDGQCIDTSMGLTPLAGLIMGTRSGDVDPALHSFLAANKGMTIAEIDSLLNKQSGLKGICGVNDMRDIHARIAEGDKTAELALKMFCYRVKHYIGAYLAALGGCDAIAFTAGIGENDSAVRALCCDTLAPLGAVFDPLRNEAAPRGQTAFLSAPGSRIAICVIPTNEELEIATQTYEVLRNGKA